MRPRIVVFWLLAGLVLIACRAHAQSSVSTMHTRVELLSEREAAAPHRIVTIGLHVVLDAGWHTYWINPGDSGEPLRVDWVLPAGWRAGPLRWPVPEWIQAGRIVNFGYEREVLLTAPLSPPARLQPGGAVRIGARVHWLVCRDVCLPAHAELSLTLPVRISPGGPTPAAPLFARTRSQWPRPMPSDWQATLRDRGQQLELTLRAAVPTRQLRFFPYNPDPIDHAAPTQVHPIAGGVRLIFRKSEFVSGPVKQLSGVLVGPGMRATEIVARVRQQAAAEKADRNLARR